MEYKNFRSLSLEDLNNYLLNLESEFSQTKEKIDLLLKEMETLDKEYTFAKKEFEKRSNLNDGINS